MALSFTTLFESDAVLPEFFSRFKEISISRGGEAESFDSIAESKVKLIESGGIVGFVMWDELNPVGMAWVERMTPTYGSILVYASEPRYRAPLVDYFVESKVAVGVMAELLHFETDDSIIALFRDKGLMEIPRQRMVCHLPESMDYPEIPDGYSLVPLSTRTALQVATLSVPAHELSGDYRGYPAMESVEGRLKLEHLVHSGFYGPLCHPATMGLVADGELRSIITNLLIPCWGHPKLPWIYDIATAPDSMGKHLGEWMLNYAKAVLVDFQYPMWGLAVSLCNTGAIRVYERNGFVVVDAFSEFLQHP